MERADAEPGTPSTPRTRRPSSWPRPARSPPTPSSTIAPAASPGRCAPAASGRRPRRHPAWRTTGRSSRSRGRPSARASTTRRSTATCARPRCSTSSTTAARPPSWRRGDGRRRRRPRPVAHPGAGVGGRRPAGLRALRRRAGGGPSRGRSTTSARAARCSTRRARPGGRRGCASRCRARRSATRRRPGADRPGHRPEGSASAPAPCTSRPAPLYHAAPLVYSMAMQRLGATVVVMERFDPRLCLELIERHRVTHAQFVPTMFVRMLRLPPAERERYDLSSLRFVVHAAAPCPVAVKRQMIDWWGPIIHEYYSGTEDIGSTFISPEEWLAHPGSVGRPLERVPHRRRRRRGAAARRGGRHLLRRRPAVRVPQRPRARRRRSPTSGAGGRSATSATSTTTATSTSPTARPT